MDRSPQGPDQKCVMPKISSMEETERRRRLGGETISRDEAETVCAANKWNEDEIEHCIFDVMATGDLELAGTAGVF